MAMWVSNSGNILQIYFLNKYRYIFSSEILVSEGCEHWWPWRWARGMASTCSFPHYTLLCPRASIHHISYILHFVTNGTGYISNYTLLCPRAPIHHISYILHFITNGTGYMSSYTLLCPRSAIHLISYIIHLITNDTVYISNCTFRSHCIHTSYFLHFTIHNTQMPHYIFLCPCIHNCL